MVSRSPLDEHGRIHFKLVLVRTGVGVLVFDPQTKGKSPATASGKVRGKWQRKQRRLIFSSSCHGTGGDHCRCDGGTLDPCGALLRHCPGGGTLNSCQEDKRSNVVEHLTDLSSR